LLLVIQTLEIIACVTLNYYSWFNPPDYHSFDFKSKSISRR